MALSFSYAQLGLFSECAKHLESAREIFEEFNNLFFLGKIDALYGMKYFNEGKYDKAIALFEDGIEKTVNWFSENYKIKFFKYFRTFLNELFESLNFIIVK